MKKILLFILLANLLYSCKNEQIVENKIPDTQDQLILSVLWFQKSPEMQALYYQGYNIAGKSLTEKLKNRKSKLPGAVVMDIDETIIDNSPFEAFLAVNNLPYSDSLWNKWTEKAIAEPLPGALEFVRYAKAKGVEVFYVTNRSKTNEYLSTLANLENKRFPFADTLHLVMKTDSSSKEERRQRISGKYDILLLVGDNLGDFDSVFDERSNKLGFDAVKQNSNKFGDNFIVLPNPMYGSWVNAALKASHGNIDREKLLNIMTTF
jgi:5'-nucleotidase (lipoprotein e(P4) family)